MKTSLVLTLIGRDRPGLVSAVAARASALGANWLESRLAQLAGQFAGVVRLEVEERDAAQLEVSLRELEAEGLQVIIERGAGARAQAARRITRLELVGHDRPGIVRDISAVLARHGVSIEEFETACESAPMSSESLFRATAVLDVPEAVSLDALRTDLEALANELMVDLNLNDNSAAW
ncbi:MAG: ACT domain-containing protein [Proteobacteria bacterium]|nr:ACT domain-containing protein [Pseudomonadota bacterium]MBS0555583.1 ACT domain-containing protein [Pseudomonadota bacterium]